MVNLMHRRLYKARKQLGLTQKQMADVLSIGQNAYSMIEGGRVALTDKNRSILAEKLYINPAFLIEGRGEVIINTAKLTENQTQKEHTMGQGVPFFSKPLPQNLPALQSLEELAAENAEYWVNLQPFNDCSFYRPVWGESMSPRYNSSDMVACKRATKEHIQWGEAYWCLMELNGDRYETIRILRQSTIDGSVALTPCNEAFDPTVVSLSAIRELYVIKGKIERNL